MNRRIRRAHFIWLLLVLTWGLCGVTPSLAQDAAELLRQGEAAIAKGKLDRAFSLKANAMHAARTKRQTALFLQAANGVARLGLNRKIKYDSAFALTKDAVRTVAFSARDTSLASLYYNLARFHKAAYEADEAIRFFNQAASVFERVEPGSLKAANCYYGLADVYKYTVYNFQLAEEYYERALGIREKQKVTDTLALFNNYYGLAATNRSQKDFEKAVSYGTVAVTLSKSLDVVRQEYAQSMIANVYRDMGNAEEAKRSYREALRLNGTTGNPTARASHYQNLAETLFDDSLYDDALQYFKLAEQLYNSMKAKDERLFLTMLNRKAMTYLEKDDSVKFEETIAQIFRELKRTGRLRSAVAAETYLIVAEYYGRAEKYYSALDQCQLALVSSIPAFTSLDFKENPTVTMIGTNFGAGWILARKGEYLSRLYRATRTAVYLEEALSCLYLAEQLLSEERNMLDTEDAKWAFLDTNYAVYESIIASLYESWTSEQQPEVLANAYQFFERSKARSLTDALTAAERARSIGADDSLLRVHGRLKAEMLVIENRVSDLAAQGNQQHRISVLRENLVALDRQLQLCTQAIEHKFPGYFNARYGQELYPLNDVQFKAREEQRVVLEYFWGSEWVYGFGISPDTVIFKRIGRSADIGRVVNQLMVHLHNEHSSSSAPVFQSFVASAHTLYQMLVKPFESSFGNSSLQVIPDGAINLVPFDILVQRMPDKSVVDYRNLDYLLKSRAIGYAYSTAMLRNIGRRVVNSPSLLAVGFTGGQRQRAPADDMRALEEIEGAEKELETLSERFRNGRFLRDREATESNFKALAADYDIIHLAIHGKGDRTSNFSASLFFRSRYDSIDDGVFHAYELYSMKLKAQMAVLSACESGIGKDYRGEGMISMASAFTSAGCENTLMSLWKVNDQASIVLMDDFYMQLLNGAPIDEALRQAKINYLERSDEITADPQTWAPLVAYGSLHQVFEKDNRSPYLILVLAFVAFFVAGTFYIRRRNRYKLGGSRSPL